MTPRSKRAPEKSRISRGFFTQVVRKVLSTHLGFACLDSEGYRFSRCDRTCVAHCKYIEDRQMRQLNVRGSLVVVLPCAVIALAGCNPRANHTGFEHGDFSLAGSQVDWIPHTYFRGVNGESFTAYKAPSVTSTNAIQTTQNPTPITANHIHGPTNIIGLGQSYAPIGEQPTH